MKNSVNLLPKEVRQKSGTSDAAKAMRSVTMIAIVLTFIVIAVGAGLVLNERRKLSGLETQRQQLLTDLQIHSQTEQQLVLVKDRVTTIESLRAENQNVQSFLTHQLLYELMPVGVSFSRQTIGGIENLYTFRSQSAVALKEYVDTITVTPEFNLIAVNQLTYNPIFGYQVEMIVQ